MAHFCGANGRLQIQVVVTMRAVAGIKKWDRNERSATQEVVHFESPTNAAGLPITAPCPGPVTITYDIEGYFFSAPATGVGFTSDMFKVGTSVLADYLFDKTGSTGIKQVTCLVTDVRMGQVIDGVATFSATLRQTSADPNPLVA